MECKKENNLSICTCSFSCDKKGMCCKCLLYHRRLGELPACYFPPDIESSGDRSIERFIEIFRQWSK